MFGNLISQMYSQGDEFSVTLMSIQAFIFLLLNTSEMLCLHGRVIRYFTNVLQQNKANCFPYSYLTDLPMAKCHVISNYFQVIITSLKHLASHCLHLHFLMKHITEHFRCISVFTEVFGHLLQS